VKTFNISDRVVIKTGKAAGRIGVVELRRMAGGNPNEYLIQFQENGQRIRRWYDKKKLELHSSGIEKED